jgi:hypothetical protein
MSYHFPEDLESGTANGGQMESQWRTYTMMIVQVFYTVTVTIVFNTLFGKHI